MYRWLYCPLDTTWSVLTQAKWKGHDCCLLQELLRAQNFSTASIKVLAWHTVVDQWGKIQTKGDPETVHSEWAQQNVNEKHRDALYVRVCSSEYLIFDPWQSHISLNLWLMNFKNNAGWQAWDKQFVGYSQVQVYIHVTLLAHLVLVLALFPLFFLFCP